MLKALTLSMNAISNPVKIESDIKIMKEHSDIDWSFKSFVDPNIPLKAKIVAIMAFTSLPFVFGGMVLMFGVMMLTLPFVLVKDLIFSLTNSTHTLKKEP
jgi:hypothetical protein